MQETAFDKNHEYDDLQNNDHKTSYDEAENSQYENNSISSVSSNLIVNYLPHEIDDLALKDLFSEFGEILMTKVVRDKNTNKSLGYGFVKFFKNDDALRAMQKLNGFSIDNKYLKVTIARPPSLEIRNCKLYITNLPLHYSENNVIDLFKEFGEIIECRVIKDKASRMNKGVAFVQFNLNSQANAALRLNGYQLEDSPRGLVIKYAEDQNKRKEVTRSEGFTNYDSQYRPLIGDDNSMLKNNLDSTPTVYYYPSTIHSPTNLGLGHNPNIYDSNINNFYISQQHPMMIIPGIQTSHLNIPTPMLQYTNHLHNQPTPHLMPPIVPIVTSPIYSNINDRYVSNQITNAIPYNNNHSYNPNLSFIPSNADSRMSNYMQESNNYNKHQTHQKKINSFNPKKGFNSTQTNIPRKEYNPLSSSHTINYDNSSRSSRNIESSHDNDTEVAIPSLKLLVSNLPLNIDSQPILHRLFASYGSIVRLVDISDNADYMKYSVEIMPYNGHTLNSIIQDTNGLKIFENYPPISVSILK